MASIGLRRAGPEDVAIITAITRAAYAKWVPLIGREPLTMRVDYSLAVEAHRIDLLCEGEAVAALIETVPVDRHILIENVAVHPDFQRRGHGRALLAHAEDLATAAGLDRVRLYTNSRFEENIRLYASLGYAVEREEALNGGIAVHMMKRLV